MVGAPQRLWTRSFGLSLCGGSISAGVLGIKQAATLAIVMRKLRQFRTLLGDVAAVVCTRIDVRLRARF